MKRFAPLLALAPALAVCGAALAGQPRALPYVVTDTGQTTAYDLEGRPVTVRPGEPLYGQDAHYVTTPMRFRDNGDGTVTDLATGLLWQKNPPDERFTWEEARQYARDLDLAGHTDWRLPSIKQLTSLADFSGSVRTRKPYINTTYFGFAYGEGDRGFRVIDSQYWSSDRYVGRTMFGDTSAFGFNFADAHIKAYPIRFGGRGGGRPEGPGGSGDRLPPRRRPPPGPGRGPFGPPRQPPREGGARQRVLCVRGNPEYGKNDFVDNGDGTVTDRATGRMWMKADSGRAMNWQDALAWAETLRLAGFDDWRLPDAKELQSIVDYRCAPAAADPAKRSPAVDSVFTLTDPESWFWTGTSHGDNLAFAVYLCFGRALSVMKTRDGGQVNAHGAGALRSDPKTGDPARWLTTGLGPQRDQVRILNYVRCVRGGLAKP